LAGIFFARPPFGADRFWTGQRTPVSKNPKWALFEVSPQFWAHMGSGHFAEFSKIAWIDKTGVLMGF